MAINTILPGESLYEAFNSLADRVAALVARTAALEEATADLPQMKEHVQQLIDEVGIISVQVTGLLRTSETHTTQITTIMVALDSVTARVTAAEADIFSLGGRLDNVESDLDDKLDKKITSGTHVYSHTGAAQNEIEVSNSVTGGTVALRTSAGNIKTAEPTENDHAATKKYVDDHSGSGGDVVVMTFNSVTLGASHTPLQIQRLFNDGKDVICKIGDDDGEYFAEVNYIGAEGYIDIVWTKSTWTLGGVGLDATVHVFRGILSTNEWMGLGSEDLATKKYVDAHSSNELFCTFTSAGNYYNCDKTYAEIKSAMENGVKVSGYLVDNAGDYFFPCVSTRNYTNIWFATLNNEKITYMTVNTTGKGILNTIYFSTLVSPNSIIIRDGLGRARVSDPINNEEITNKRYVDGLAAPISYTLTLNSDESSATLTGGTYEQLRTDIMAGKNALVTMAASQGSVLTSCVCAALIDGSTYLKFYCDTPWNMKYTIKFDATTWTVTK